jgi:addiction module HigA family antidote
MPIKNTIPAIGEVLAREFLEPMNISQNALARAIGVAPSRITDIVNGRRAITADTDLRLTRCLGCQKAISCVYRSI